MQLRSSGVKPCKSAKNANWHGPCNMFGMIVKSLPKAHSMARQPLKSPAFITMLIALASILILSSGSEMTAQAAQTNSIASLGLGHYA
jgi:hypothetical protein